ncbi:MAG: baseplate J/gp47 family protein [Lachnospiraceae bacterium]|nr:baseplate J/gp47 family protein [Lachnospiraceae bacterium]
MLEYYGTPLKTYEERYDEAISRIPLYTKEWTNFNVADPGITILETLTGFNTLQGNRFEDVPPEARRNLLKMVGFNAMRSKMSRVLLSTEGISDKVVLPPNHKFQIGNIVFETARQTELEGNKLLGIFGKKEDKFTEFSQLLDNELKIPLPIFGEKPEAGDELYLIMEKAPDPGKEMSFYVILAEHVGRNPIPEKWMNSFASMRFEIYGQGGFKELKVRDQTNAFLNSGEIRMKMAPDTVPAMYREAPKEGYCIRITLDMADYDVPPKCTSFEAFLLEVWQKNTISECHTIQKYTEFELCSELLDRAYVDVFCKEERGSSYHRYTYTTGGPSHGGRKGRYFEREDIAPGKIKIKFNKEKYGFGPERLKNCVKVVLYTEEVMRQYALERVLGYDGQQIDLPYAGIVPDAFCVIARRKAKDGYIYDFVRPGKSGEGDLFYHLLENDGRLLIEDAGSFIGSDLFLCAIALSAGPAGNIREGSELKSMPEIPGANFRAVSPGTGGSFRERLESVRQRFLKDMERPYAAVTEEDYERLVLETPGLCIHKAKAFMDVDKNLVKISVKPSAGEELPKLSKSYHRIITKRLEERRLLTTRIELASPVYTKVNVSGTVYVKLHFENSKKLIEDAIREKTDYLSGGQNFADVLRFDDVFHAIELLDCVEYVYDLSLRPASNAYAKLKESDIYPAENCLLIPGNIAIETVTYER